MIGMINSYTKDVIIKWLITNFEPTPQIQVSSSDLAACFDISDHVLRLFLKQLHRMQIIDYSELGAGHIMLMPHMELYDFHSRGGFTVQDELLKKNIEKLHLEIEKLKPHFSEKAGMFANLSAIAGTIMSALKFLP
jgi:hypothetical protein